MSIITGSNVQEYLIDFGIMKTTMITVSFADERGSGR
jgi:hypothetical protein